MDSSLGDTCKWGLRAQGPLKLLKTDCSSLEGNFTPLQSYSTAKTRIFMRNPKKCKIPELLPGKTVHAETKRCYRANFVL